MKFIFIQDHGNKKRGDVVDVNPHYVADLLKSGVIEFVKTDNAKTKIVQKEEVKEEVKIEPVKTKGRPKKK